MVAMLNFVTCCGNQTLGMYVSLLLCRLHHCYAYIQQVHDACCELHNAFLTRHDKLKTAFVNSCINKSLRLSHAAMIYTPAELAGDADDTGDGGEARAASKGDGPCAGEAAGELPL